MPFNTKGFGPSPLKATMGIGAVAAPIWYQAQAIGGNLNTSELCGCSTT